MQADRMVEALRRYVLAPGEDVEKRWDRPESVALSTKRFGYLADSADWLIRNEVWVDDAVRVIADGFMDNYVITYGLVSGRDGSVLFLNDVATMMELGRRLGDGLDPLAYAELLAELYSGRQIDGPVVLPFSATASLRSGWLIRDVEAFLRKYPFVAAALVGAPQVSQAGGVCRVEFCSHNYYLLEFGSAIDIYRWVVTAPVGQPASWSREPAAEFLIAP